MNILPLVSAFILIFAIGSYTFVHNQLCAVQERQHFYRAFAKSHHFQRTLVSARYRKIRGENLHPKKRSDRPARKADYRSPRDRSHPCKEAKLNIAPMMHSSNPKLDALFVAFVNHLYRFYPGDERRYFGSKLLQLMKKKKALGGLEDLLALAEEKDRDWVYKILKGTHNADWEHTVGYPALGDFIRIGQRREKSIYMCHATRPLLEVLCGPHIAPMIIWEERAKWKVSHKHIPIKRQELIPILASRNFDLTSIEDFIDFSPRKHAPSDPFS